MVGRFHFLESQSTRLHSFSSIGGFQGEQFFLTQNIQKDVLKYMERIVAHRSKRNVLVLASPLLAVWLALLVAIPSFDGRGMTTRAATSFRFTAAGDYGQTATTTATFTQIGSAGASFDLGLGDFNYHPQVSAASWSTYAKSHLPSGFPFEIVAGDHDSQLSTLAADLPNRMSTLSGTYGSQYAFDYPAAGPIARFVMLSPALGHTYTKGSADYNWVASEITGARSANIHWVIAGMAEGCLFVSSAVSHAKCSSVDLFNLLMSLKVDLILQAHHHNYEAGKQVAPNGTTCPSIPTTSYNAACVVNGSSSMTRGAGTTILNVGTAGVGLAGLTPTDPMRGYFRSLSGANVTPSYGFVSVTVSSTSVSVQFVHVKGSFSDSFSING